jgi:hypothetical protein
VPHRTHICTYIHFIPCIYSNECGSQQVQERWERAHYAIYECCHRRQHDASGAYITLPRAAPPAAVAMGKKCVGRNAMCAHGIRLPMQNPARTAADNSLGVYVHKWLTPVLRAIDRLTHISGKKRHFPRQFSLSLARLLALTVAASFA